MTVTVCLLVPRPGFPSARATLPAFWLWACPAASPLVGLAPEKWLVNG